MAAHDVPVSEGHITARELRLMASLRVRCREEINSLAKLDKRLELISEVKEGTATASNIPAIESVTISSKSVVPDCFNAAPNLYLQRRTVTFRGPPVYTTLVVVGL